MKIYILSFLFIFFSSIFSFAQEIYCTVQVNSQQIQTSDKRIFESLQKDIFEFINNKRWTNHSYKTEERIECSILINITKWNNSDQFDATIQVQSTRPIFNTSYNSTLLNFKDNDFAFKYVEFQPLEFIENTHSSNLTSVIAYYVYLILGYDYDTFQSLGGTEFYQIAENIVNNAQSDPLGKGWNAFDGKKNRYWIIKEILDPSFKPLRECLYKYHRLGLDKLSKEKDPAIRSITESLESLLPVYRKKPGSFVMQLFLNAKSDEIVNIFSEAYPQDKAKIVNLLKQMDPANGSKYDQLMK